MRMAIRTKNIVRFFDEGYMVGAIDYSNKSDHYIEDAITNWEEGIMTVETVERHSTWYYVKDSDTHIGVDMSFSSMRNK